jgi:LacI family transcriptional regulator
MARGSKQTTIKTIAHEAGVSISTVSNVLNGNTQEMSPETLQRVQEVIARLNYRPNQIARGLVTSKTSTIGLILAEIETPLFLQALPHIERDARLNGYNLVLNHARNTEEERAAVELMLDKKVEGVIFLSTSEVKEESHLKELQEAQIPTVLVNRSTHHENLDQINWDNTNAVYLAVNHLIELGHRRIAHLLGPNWRAGTQYRLDGFKRALDQHGIECRAEYLQNGDYTAEPDLWRESTHVLLALPEPPTAIVASDDLVAAVVIDTIRQAGLDVPGDLSVVGIDDQPIFSFMALTTIRLPVVEAGKQAIKLLIQRIQDPHIAPSHIVLPCLLIERRTSGPLKA